MRYVKTFENFNHNTTNEGLLWGEGSIWEKAKKWWNTWKNEKMTEGAETFQKVFIYFQKEENHLNFLI